MNTEEQFDFNYIINTIQKWFLLILFFGIVGLSLAIFYVYTAPLKYESYTTLYVEPQVNSSVVTYEGILTNQSMVKIYKQIIQSRKIIEKVITNLDIKYSYDELLDFISVSSVSDTEMIKINVVTKSAKLSSNIANEISLIFIETIKEDLGITNIAVIDGAIISDVPVELSMTKMSIIGLGLGFVIGLLLAFLIESMDNKIKNHDDVKKYLKIKTLGVIPDYSIDYENIDKKHKKKYIKPKFGIDLKIIKDPNSVVSESIRMLRTNLNFLDLKVVNLLSTVPSEGKTEVLSNLAISFAMLDKRVLVVDCDLRKPKIHKNFGLFRKDGISDIVLSRGTRYYKDAVQTFEDKETKIRIDVLTAGSKISNPSELINSKNFAKVIEDMKNDYDLILIDCPPISAMTDGVLISQLSDGTVYVIESDRTDYQVIGNCIEELKSNNAFVLGAVLTKVNVRRQKKMYGYKYDYYYSNYNG